MKGNEFWSCAIDEEAVTWQLDYDGFHATIWFKHNNVEDSLLIPAEIMDRLAGVWQQWRKIDKETQE